MPARQASANAGASGARGPRTSFDRQVSAKLTELRKKPRTNTPNGARQVDPDKPLTQMQRDFVRIWASGETINSAAIRAGYSDGGSMAYRLSVMPNIRALYEREKALYEEAAQMTRKKVMDGILEGIECAKLVSEPAAMINGWKTIGQMCGYFEPRKQTIDINVHGNVTYERITKLSDAELLKIIQEGAQQDLKLLEHGDDADEAA